MNELNFFPAWTAEVNSHATIHGLNASLPKWLIVNQEDMGAYEEFLMEKYKGPIPTSDGYVRFKGVKLAISKDLGRGQAKADFD